MRSIVLVLCLLSSLSTYAQNIEVALEIKGLSPYIASLQKSELEMALLDSVVNSCQRTLRKFSNELVVFHKFDSLKINPTYKLHLNIVDTVIDNGVYNDIHSVMVYSKFNEARLPIDSVNKSMDTSGVSYSFNASPIIESEVLKTYFDISKVGANASLFKYLPLSLTRSLPSRNLPKHALALLDVHRDIVIGINYAKASSQKSNEQLVIVSMINNVFLRRQYRYYNTTRHKKANFNYYFESDAIPASVLNAHPIKIEFLISENEGVFTIQLQSPDNDVVLDFAKSLIVVKRELLQERPTWVNGMLSDCVASFVFKNL